MCVKSTSLLLHEHSRQQIVSLHSSTPPVTFNEKHPSGGVRIRSRAILGQTGGDGVTIKELPCFWKVHSDIRHQRLNSQWYSCGAEEVLLSPEVVELVGTSCSLQPSKDGHALLLGMAASDVVAPASMTAVQSSDLKGALELSVLPTGLQQLAVQVLRSPCFDACISSFSRVDDCMHSSRRHWNKAACRIGYIIQRPTHREEDLGCLR